MAQTKRELAARKRRLTTAAAFIKVATIRGAMLCRLAGYTTADDPQTWGFPMLEAADMTADATPEEVAAASYLLPSTYRAALRAGWGQALRKHEQHAEG